MIVFHVSGIPAPQGSKTAMPVRKNGKLTGKTNLVESSKALKPWRTLVTNQARRAKPKGFTPYAGAVRVEVVFRFPRPNGHYGTGRNAGTLKPSAPEHHITKPDIDKTLRAILDALTAAGIYRDDSQVVDVRTTKGYAPDDTTGALITIERIGE